MWDIETTFSNRQTLATADSDNIVDIGPDDPGLGEPIYLQVSLSAGCSGGLSVGVDTSPAEAMTDPVRVAQYAVDAAVVARGGTVLVAALPTGCRRYLRLAYSGASGGTVTAGLVQGAQTAGMR